MKLQKFYIKGVKKIQKNFFNKGDKSFNSAARILLKVLKNSIASLIMEKAISKKIELMKERKIILKYFHQKQIPQKLVEEYSKYFEGSEKESEGLDYTDG